MDEIDEQALAEDLRLLAFVLEEEELTSKLQMRILALSVVILAVQVVIVVMMMVLR